MLKQGLLRNNATDPETMQKSASCNFCPPIFAFCNWISQNLRVIIPFLLHPAERGTHFICQTGEPVQKLGVVTEHLVVLRFLVHDIVVNLPPAFLEQGSALNFNILPLILDNIMQGSVDTIGNDLDLVSVINLAVAGTLVGSGTFRQIIMVGIFIKIL